MLMHLERVDDDVYWCDDWQLTRYNDSWEVIFPPRHHHPDVWDFVERDDVTARALDALDRQGMSWVFVSFLSDALHIVGSFERAYAAAREG